MIVTSNTANTRRHAEIDPGTPVNSPESTPINSWTQLVENEDFRDP